ncbi:MAG: hypothetical protein ACRDON_00165, partial [Gaiellaceae bacterium]
MMRQQLRLRVLLPVAVLGLLGVGYGAFAYGQGPDVPESIPVAAPTTTEAAPKPKSKAKPKATPKPKPKHKPAPNPTLSALQRELDENGVAVVVFYNPEDDRDSLAVLEARAGADAANAGFLAVNVMKETAVRSLAAAFEVLRAPAVVVVVPPRRVKARFLEYVDRATV